MVPSSFVEAAGAPIVIGGTGGSGTRVLRNALIAAGVFMGSRVNDAGDAMEFEPWLDSRIDQVLAVTGTLDYRLDDLPEPLRLQTLDELRARVIVYLEELPGPGVRWGWKNPRSIFMLPFLAALFPGLHFIHLVRDGRDMALSSNQNQFRKHAAALGIRVGDAMDPAEGSAAMWQRVNCGAAVVGPRQLQQRYTAVRFEDLCERPREILHRLWGRLDLKAGTQELDSACETIRIPAGIGRWRSRDLEAALRVHRQAGTGLRRFGYSGLRGTPLDSEVLAPATQPGPLLIALPESESEGSAQALVDLRAALRNLVLEGAVGGCGQAAEAAARVDSWVAADRQHTFASIVEDEPLRSWLLTVASGSSLPAIVTGSRASLTFWIRWCEHRACVPTVVVLLPAGLKQTASSSWMRAFFEYDLWTRGCPRSAYVVEPEGLGTMSDWLNSLGWGLPANAPTALSRLLAAPDGCSDDPIALRRLAGALRGNEGDGEHPLDIGMETFLLCARHHRRVVSELERVQASCRQQAIEAREQFLAQRELMRLFERLYGDTQALFASLTWKLGDRIAEVARVLLRLPRATVRDHVAYLHRRFLEWRRNGQVPVGRLTLRSPARPPSSHALKVVAMICRHADGSPIASAYVRLILPLTHPSVHDRVDFKVIAADALESADAQLLIVQRTAVQTPALAEQIIQHCRNRKIGLVLELDDDLFVTGSEIATRGSYGRQRIDAMRRIACAADHVVVSTEPLKQVLERYNQEVCVVFNALDEYLWRTGERSGIADGPQDHDRDADQVRILYMGTRTHAKDLRIVGDALRRIRARYGDRVGIELIGGLPEDDATWDDVFTRIDATVPEEYPDFVRWLRSDRRWDIGIIPLESSSFNRSKSGLKFLDFSALGLAIVCSHAPAYAGVARHEVNALCAEPSVASWYAQLSRLIDDAELRRQLSAVAYEDLQRLHLLGCRAPEYADVLQGVVDGLVEVERTRVAPPPAFDEAAYLERNPDVAALVAAGYWSCGREYWEQIGRIEAALGEPMGQG